MFKRLPAFLRISIAGFLLLLAGMLAGGWIAIRFEVPSGRRRAGFVGEGRATDFCSLAAVS